MGLPLNVDLAHVEYKFMAEDGESIQNFTTLSVECAGVQQRAPVFEYTCIHHIPKVTQKFIDFITEPMEYHLYVSPVAKIPAASPISTANPRIVAGLKGEAMPTIDELMKKNTALEAQLAEKDAEIARLKGDTSIPAAKLAGAVA